jgi:serine phosphatase RsbU (regulator of sigma subunit)
MKKRRNFQIILTISLVLIIQAGFWSFTFLSRQYLTNELIEQIKDDNRVIGEQLITLLGQTGLTNENPETDSVLQHICDRIQLPNGGFICAINKSGNLVAAPGLKPGMTMKFPPILWDTQNKSVSIQPVDLKPDTIFEGYAFFAEENRLDVVASLSISDDLRLFVHQNSEFIRQKAGNSVKPLIFIGLFVTLIAGLFTWFTTNRIVKRYESKIEAQNIELRDALEKISEKQVEIIAQNEELERQRNELEISNHKISEQKKEITDSIQYAERIQKATLPKSKITCPCIEDYFILFKPRDIVSGDFFWYHQAEDRLIITAVDCTGHGVPGAFMSMLGVSFLNELVIKEGFTDPGLILDHLRLKVVHALGQELGKNTATDGMDMALCSFNSNKPEMEFAGANNPLVIIRDNEYIEFKGNKMPVGIYGRMDEPFTNHNIPLKSKDNVYLFSDGFSDQFGGSQARKFMKKNFRDLLMTIKDLPMMEQKQLLEETFIEWRVDIPQVDDVLVIGLKIK